MELTSYLEQKSKLYDFILDYLESENDIDDSLLTENLKKNPIYSDFFEFKEFLHILVKISKNHHWNATIDKRMKSILIYFSENIIHCFTNFEIVTLFKNCKKILLFLLKKQIAKIDESTIDIFINMVCKDRYYCHFFYPEIKSLNSNEIDLTEIENEILQIDEFEAKRENGENDSYICKLIREDSVEEFIEYINKNCISLSSKIKQSIFETNQLLIKKGKITLIEYATFFGSIQIFRFLMFNNVKLTSSLWIYSVHSKNAEFIHLLEDCNIKYNDKVYNESIKCHHNDFADYIQNVLLKEPLCNSKVVDYCMHYYNYKFLTSDIDMKLHQLLLSAAAYDHYNIVKILLQNRNIDINKKINNIQLYKFIKHHYNLQQFLEIKKLLILYSYIFI